MKAPKVVVNTPKRRGAAFAARWREEFKRFFDGSTRRTTLEPEPGKRYRPLRPSERHLEETHAEARRFIAGPTGAGRKTSRSHQDTEVQGYLRRVVAHADLLRAERGLAVIDGIWCIEDGELEPGARPAPVPPPSPPVLSAAPELPRAGNTRFPRSKAHKPRAVSGILIKGRGKRPGFKLERVKAPSARTSMEDAADLIADKPWAHEAVYLGKIRGFILFERPDPDARADIPKQAPTRGYRKVHT